MLTKYFSIIRNYVSSVFRKESTQVHLLLPNTLIDAFRTNSRNIIGRNPSMVMPLLANQDLTAMLIIIINIITFTVFVAFCIECWISQSCNVTLKTPTIVAKSPGTLFLFCT